MARFNLSLRERSSRAGGRDRVRGCGGRAEPAQPSAPLPFEIARHLSRTGEVESRRKARPGEGAAVAAEPPEPSVLRPGPSPLPLSRSGEGFTHSLALPLRLMHGGLASTDKPYARRPPSSLGLRPSRSSPTRGEGNCAPALCESASPFGRGVRANSIRRFPGRMQRSGMRPGTRGLLESAPS
jgi:hypothetical protein